MRQAILDCAQVRRLHDGDRLTTRGAAAQEWCGVAEAEGEEIRIGLALAQEDRAQLLGASRQRVNRELKGFERNGALRVEPTRWVVLSREKLLALSEHV